MTAAAPAAAPAADHGHKDPWAPGKTMAGIGLGLFLLALGFSAILGPVEGALNIFGARIEMILRVAVIFTGLSLVALAVKTRMTNKRLEMEQEHELRMLIANQQPHP